MKSPICSCTEVQWKKRNVCTNVHSEIVTNLSDTMCASSGPTRRIHLRRGMVQFSSVAQSCPTLCDPMDHSMPGLLVHHQLSELPKLISIESVMPFNHLILCHALLLPPSIFPSIRVFSNESALRITWPKYWSFSFSISPSNEHPGLISRKN